MSVVLTADNHRVFVDKLDHGQKKSTSGDSAMARFKQMDSKAQTNPGDTELNTVHQNTITYVLRVWLDWVWAR